jgi:hypothetical protein
VSAAKTAEKPRYRVPRHTEYVEISLDEFDNSAIAEYLRHEGYAVSGESTQGGGADDTGALVILEEEVERISTLLLCGQRDAAREFAFQIISDEIGRRL